MSGFKRYSTDCNNFSGYKPCALNPTCDHACPSYSKVSGQILIVHLEALGAVLRATAILNALKRKYPNHQINWVTKKSAKSLLLNNPLIDRIFTLESEDQLLLSCFSFDLAIVVDKSQLAFGLTKKLKIKKMVGFGVEESTGAIVPMNSAADELYELGLNNHKKFNVNHKTEVQLMLEAFELEEQCVLVDKNPYILNLNAEELRESKSRKELWLEQNKFVIGINVGCSATIPYKKLGVEQHIRLIEKLKSIPDISIVLLGGQEDFETSHAIANHHQQTVIVSNHQSGLRDGAVSMDACDIVISGDSLGMHLGIALKKWVVAWFGPTCAHEIELYGRGVKILSDASCGPCWKRSCHKSVMCYDLVQLQKIISGVEQGIQWQMSLSKQPSSEISS